MAPQFIVIVVIDHQKKSLLFIPLKTRVMTNKVKMAPQVKKGTI